MQVVRRISGALGTLLLAFLAAFTIATATGWLAVTPVLSGSMRPGYNPGDAMLTERVSPASVHVGDIVNVKVPAKDGGGQRVHRVIAVRHPDGSVAIQTRGDANHATDPGWIVLKGDQYRAIARLPYVGWIVNLRAAHGTQILLAAIVFLAGLSILQRFRSRRRRPVFFVPDATSASRP